MRNDTFIVSMMVLIIAITVNVFSSPSQGTMRAEATINPSGIPVVHEDMSTPEEFTSLMDSIFGALSSPRPGPSIGNIPGGVPGIPNIHNEPSVVPGFPGNIFGSGTGAFDNLNGPPSGTPGNIFGP
jgi:hypothetical protein